MRAGMISPQDSALPAMAGSSCSMDLSENCDVDRSGKFSRSDCSGDFIE